MTKFQPGYVLLISAVIISAVLLTLALSVALGSFYSRSNGLDFASKRRSFFLAWSCLDKARLNIALNPQAPGIGNAAIAADNCEINAIGMDEPIVGQITITASATVNRAATILQLTVSKDDLSLISWEEKNSLTN